MKFKLALLEVNPNNPAGMLPLKAWNLLLEAEEIALSVNDETNWLKALAEANIGKNHLTLLAKSAVEIFERSLLEWYQGNESKQKVWICDISHPYLPQPKLVLEKLGIEEYEELSVCQSLPGAEVIETVRLMEQLHSEKGDAWSLSQTHASLARYLLEECYETLEILDQIDEVQLENKESCYQELSKELGDLLFQIVFHAKVSQKVATAAGERIGFSVDEVARALNQKMYRRNQHVFGQEPNSGLSIEEIINLYESQKAREKQEATEKNSKNAFGASELGSLLAEIAPGLPALQTAFKLGYKARVNGNFLELKSRVIKDFTSENPRHKHAAALMLEVLEMVQSDEDPESALRAKLKVWVA